MPQHLADFRQRQSLPQHIDGKRMTQLMRPGNIPSIPARVIARRTITQMSLCDPSPSKGARERRNTPRHVDSDRPCSR
jgi:hypothetical protein